MRTAGADKWPDVPVRWGGPVSRWVRPFCLSVGVHAGLLAAVATFAVPRDQPPALLRVSLLPPGGGTAAPGGQSSDGPPVPPRAAKFSPPKPMPKAQGQRRRVRNAERQRRVTPPAAVSRGPEAGVPRNESSPVQRAAKAPRAGAGNEADDGIGAGAASASGRGVGAGWGAGVGTGSGDGVGAGVGDGVDQRAHCVYCPQPRYPMIARRRGWQGTVDIGLSVLANGTVGGARVRQSSGHQVLDRAAMAVARVSRFTPPAAGGLRAPLEARIEYRFVLAPAL